MQIFRILNMFLGVTVSAGIVILIIKKIKMFKIKKKFEE